MREIRAATSNELDALCRAIELVRTEALTGVVLVQDGQVAVTVGYDNWTDGSATMHIWIADPKAMGRDILRAAFDYPFRQCGKQVVIGVVRSDNPEALSFDIRVGFKTQAVIPDAYGPGISMYILSLHRSECKWCFP